MTQTVQLKRSATSGAIPSTSDLSLGELAINTYDGKAYIKKNVGGTESIVEVGAEQAKFNQMSHNLFNASANQTTFSGTDANGDSLSYTAGQIFKGNMLEITYTEYKCIFYLCNEIQVFFQVAIAIQVVRT